MIEIVEGRGVGAGKSYYVTTRILKYLSEGGIIYASSSFALNLKEARLLIADRWGVEIEDDQFHTFEQEDIWRLHEISPPGTDEKPVLIVIDEAHTALNARDWADTKKRPFFNWLTQSRHDNNDLIFISQSAHNIDKQIARLVTYIVRTRNMMNFSIPGLGKWPMKQFVIAQFDQDGKTLLNKRWIPHDRSVFKCYISKSCRGSHRRLNEGVPPRTLKRVTKKPTQMIKLFIAAMLCLGLFGGYRLFSAKTKPKEVAVVQSNVNITQAPPPPPAPDPMYVEEEWKSFSDARRMFHEGPARLITMEGAYVIGSPSKHGMVCEVGCADLRIAYATAKCAIGQKITYVIARVGAGASGSAAYTPTNHVAQK